ncbi:MAG TPA: YbaK/EbsC family protein [Cryptosporangiaceae bacterium]|nr:YbaK/EbsC family protein [Cryptosporangiaceae bacterium]
MPLDWKPAADHPELLAPPVASVAAGWQGPGPLDVAEIDPAAADTEAFCARYGVRPDQSANCVVVAGRRGGETRHAAVMVLATTRADVNGLVRRHLDVRKVSFAPLEEVVAATGMEYGGVTPLGLPAQWPVLLDRAVAAAPWLVVGSGLRGSKLALSGAALAALPRAEVLDDLGLSRA